MSKDEFVAWWLETEFGRKKQLHWSGNRTAACWQHFDQVANAKTGKPGAKCRQCHKVLDHPANGRYGTTALHRHLAGPTCRKSTRQKTNIKGLLINAEHKLLKLLSPSRLPFRFIEHAEFRDVIAYARLAPTQPQIPSAKTMRSRLRGYVQEQQQSILKQLPPGHWEYREILLGFQPLSGSHTGVNLSEVVLKLLQQHKITDRVLAVTTDNASNNKTMTSSIQESLQSLELNNATPKNEHAEMNWSEDRVRSLRVRQQKREIIDTLNKVRNLAIYINASPQRRESFCNLQTEEPKLVPIQDVRTRWNSTFLMLRRAKRLQSTFDEFCSQYDQDHFALNQEEWRQIEYLLWITQPFFKFTSLLSKTKDVSIHLIFSIYNKLFAHLEKSKNAQSASKTQSPMVAISELEMECQQETSQPLLSGQYDELKEYLETGTVRTPTAVFWKDHQRQFPALANLARDVLSIPATGAGVERPVQLCPGCLSLPSRFTKPINNSRSYDVYVYITI
ncbi:Pc19g00750 [Penicillium rubens Wisconsin 54-1255]|uniref:Pc19g00750 protein n=1 Tax=Penicillium rubens (strain ATCC 28089 / DSM 1075 / NRRL 1951 / Wisconsin 54-1255) TaxID=500485 RepID=B6HD62_PENRW|nr:Pc19g00750 [Penicillium rubens Wisconsin 54-1255]